MISPCWRAYSLLAAIWQPLLSPLDCSAEEKRIYEQAIPAASAGWIG